MSGDPEIDRVPSVPHSGVGATTVVTINRDRHHHLDNLLAGLAAGSAVPDHAVVVDLGSRTAPQTATATGLAACAAAGIDVSFHRLAPNPTSELQLAAARNLGAAVAPSDHLVFLDVDCIPGPDLVASYRTYHVSGLVCGPVRYLREGWVRRCPDRTVGQLQTASREHPARPTPDVDRTDDRFELFWSLSFATDRETFDRIGGFDERYVGYGGEDTDFAYRARRAGVPLRWLAAGTAYHQWHPSQSPPVDHLDSIVANANLFHRTWDRWPMEGWLAAFESAGLVRWTDREVVAVPQRAGAVR